jgi:exopolyphosphatase/guanosine-5'-triphosphate,3'-diphosphate pyrophosphatase
MPNQPATSARVIRTLLKQIDGLRATKHHLSTAAEAKHRAGAVIRRAAWDIGSGMTKVRVADVDTQSGYLVQTLLEEEIEVLYGADWKASKEENCLSETITKAGLDAVQLLQAKANQLGAQQSSGVATEVFRKAKNGPQLLDKMRELGLTVQLISQDDEAELGFQTAISSGTFDPTAVVAWDSGGGSFQISYRGDPSSKLQVRIDQTDSNRFMQCSSISQIRLKH